MIKKLRVTLTVLLIFGIVFGVTVAAFSAFALSDGFVQLDKEKLSKLDCNLTMVDVDGNEYHDVFEGKTAKVKIDELSDFTKNAFISIEDKRFYSHNGIDVVRVFGATLNNLKKRSLAEGASTITQQLVKNTYLANEKTFKRKLNEMILAMRVEELWTKDEILEMYLNTIYFGGDAYGIENAAKFYFDVSAKQLDLAQSATLAGLIKAPYSYSPIYHADKCVERRNLVLDTMKNNSFASEQEVSAAKAQPLNIAERKNMSQKGYFLRAQEEARAILGADEGRFLSENYRVETYFNQNAQKSLEKALQRGDVSRVGLVADNETRGISACAEISDSDCFYAKRQIGSCAKPLAVYAPSLNEKLLCPLSPILDEKTNFGGYQPQNAGEQYLGWTSVDNALSKSLNNAAVSALNCLGVKKSCEYLAKLGFDCKNENLSLALGNLSRGADARQLLSAYAVFANGGDYLPCSFVKSISKNGKIVYLRDDNEKRVFSDATAFLTTKMLCNAAKSGTAKVLSSLPFDVAAKTGTVGNEKGNTDALLCGYTTSETFVFWFQSKNEKDISGGRQSAECAKEYLLNTTAENGEFCQPQSVVKLSVDADCLTNNQKLRQGQNGKTIEGYFDKDNLPFASVDVKPDGGKEIEKPKNQNDDDVTADDTKNDSGQEHHEDVKKEKQNFLDFWYLR